MKPFITFPFPKGERSKGALQPTVWPMGRKGRRGGAYLSCELGSQTPAGLQALGLSDMLASRLWGQPRVCQRGQKSLFPDPGSSHEPRTGKYSTLHYT